MTKVLQGTQGYSYPSSTPAKEVRLGTPPFRGVPEYLPHVSPGLIAGIILPTGAEPAPSIASAQAQRPDAGAASNTSPADHPAKIGDMVSPPYFGPGEARTKFVRTTTAEGVASFGETGQPSLLKRESSGTPEGVLEVLHTPSRLARFHALGLPDPEALAARLAHRDRDLDDRRLCLECRHLAGHAQGAWRCSNWPKAGMVAIRAVYVQLSPELVTLLQRCDGFDGLIPNPESTTP